MASLKVLTPDATKNYITNPQLRYDASGWTAEGATITRVQTYARFGIASLQVVTNGAALREGAFFRVSSLSGVSSSITVSVYVRGTGKVRLRLDDNIVGGAEYVSQPVPLVATRWQRIEVSGLTTGGDDLRLYVETSEDGSVVRTFYLDGAQMEMKDYATTYCDGDQPGCRWNGVYHNSTSERYGNTRLGGKWLELAGPAREQEDLYMTVIGGLGAAPLVNQVQAFALKPGGYYQDYKIGMRPITLTFHAKHKIDDREDPISLGHLHQLRQTLIDLIKPDLTSAREELYFEYTDGSAVVYFSARYDGGLDGEWDIRNQFINTFPVRLLAVQPLILEDQQEIAALDFQETLAVNNITARIHGVWNHMNYGLSSTAWQLATGPKGEVYASGKFALANENASAIDPNIDVEGIAYWDGEKWVTMGSGKDVMGSQDCVAVAPNGYVYVGGNFTSINGVAANRIAYWNGSTWNPMGSGMNNLVLAIAVAPNGDVYAGGSFTTAGGVACNRIARWDGYQWRVMGQYNGLDDYVRSITIAQDGLTLYCAGKFRNQNGFATNLYNKVAQYNTTTGLFTPMTNTFDNNDAYVIRAARSGLVYLGGMFVDSVVSGISKIAVWNGSAWLGMGGGLSSGAADYVRGIDFDQNGKMYVTGTFSTAGGRTAKNIAAWNGSTWENVDINLGILAGYDVVINPNNNDLFFSTNGSANSLVSGITQINNIGSAEVAPKVYIKGSGKLVWLENQTTQQRISLDLDIQANEEVFIDFALGQINSTTRGRLLYTLYPASCRLLIK